MWYMKGMGGLGGGMLFHITPKLLAVPLFSINIIAPVPPAINTVILFQETSESEAHGLYLTTHCQYLGLI